MVVQVEFQSLIDDTNCVNGSAAPPLNRLMRSLMNPGHNETLVMYTLAI